MFLNYDLCGFDTMYPTKRGELPAECELSSVCIRDCPGVDSGIDALTIN